MMQYEVFYVCKMFWFWTQHGKAAPTTPTTAAAAAAEVDERCHRLYIDQYQNKTLTCSTSKSQNQSCGMFDFGRTVKLLIPLLLLAAAEVDERCHHAGGR